MLEISRLAEGLLDSEGLCSMYEGESNENRKHFNKIVC